MPRRHVVSVSWGDHLIFGEGDGKLDASGALFRRMQHWQEDLEGRHATLAPAHNTNPGSFLRRERTSRQRGHSIDWDDLEIVLQAAHKLGMRAYLYVSLFDEGWPLAPKKVRAVSYHNVMHHQHVSWQSAFSRDHPEYALVDRGGQERQVGVLCLAYPEVRSHFCQRFQSFLEGSEFDGLFLCLRSQVKPSEFADQYGFNRAVRDDFLAHYGKDIEKEDFDLAKWRDLLGEYLTLFLEELGSAVRGKGLRLAVGCARGNVLGSPLGNATLQWRQWIEKDLIDELVVNQNSSQCPSMWHDLWPMHRGYGYVQNYLDESSMLSLQEDLAANYAPAFRGHSVKLYVARQWDQRSETEGAALLRTPGVQGLVFSSFRFDNPGPVARNHWVA